jgi:hypothetical protein
MLFNTLMNLACRLFLADYYLIDREITPISMVHNLTTLPVEIISEIMQVLDIVQNFRDRMVLVIDTALIYMDRK